MQNDPTDDDILLLSIKKLSNKLLNDNTFLKNADNANPFQNQQQRKDFTSDLTKTDEIFFSNPIKAIKHKRMNDLLEDKGIHRDMLKLVDAYKVDDNVALNELRQELSRIGNEIEG